MRSFGFPTFVASKSAKRAARAMYLSSSLAGIPKTSTFAREYPLHRSVQGQDRVIGTLRVEATLAGIYRRLAKTGSTILATQAATIFLVSLFVLYFFHYLVTRHLSAIAADVGSHRIKDALLELRLRRRPLRHEDELERVATAFNALSHDLHIAYRDLAEREAKIRRLVDANIIGIFIWDFEGRVLEANDAFLRMFGYSRDDLAAGRLNWTEMTPPEWQSRGKRAVEELTTTGTALPYEKEFFRKDGSRVPVLIGAAFFEVSRKEGVAFVLDLTDRKKAEVALRESEERFRDYAEVASDWFWETGPDHRFTEFSRTAADWELPADLVGKTRCDLAADREKEPEKWRAHISTLEAHQPFRGFRYRISRLDGSSTYVSMSGKPVFDSAGTFLGYRGVATDVSAEVRAAEALRDSEEQWKAVFENNPVMYFMVDATGTILSVNPFGAEQLGYRADELIGRPMDIVFHAADREAVQRNAAICFEQLGQAVSWELRKVRKDGEIVWVRETARATVINTRPVLLIVCEDITEGKRAAEALREVQAELAHANRVAALGQLTASIAHEVNQPVAGVLSSGQAALRWLDRPDLEAARRAIERVIRDATRAGDVISGLRALVKKSPPRTESFDVNEAIREVIVVTRGEAAKSGISVKTQLAEGLPLIHGDRVQLQQVILNLIINAIEAMSGISKGPRELLIKTAKSESDCVSVTVQDTGPGLDPANSDRAFEAFYTTKPDGLGIGLSICRSIVEAHGGELAVTANMPHGAVFQFTVPTRGDGS